jgi:hypothetical protein
MEQENTRNRRRSNPVRQYLGEWPQKIMLQRQKGIIIGWVVILGQYQFLLLISVSNASAYLPL